MAKTTSLYCTGNKQNMYRQYTPVRTSAKNKRNALYLNADLQTTLKVNNQNYNINVNVNHPNQSPQPIKSNNIHATGGGTLINSTRCKNNLIQPLNSDTRNQTKAQMENYISMQLDHFNQRKRSNFLAAASSHINRQAMSQYQPGSSVNNSSQII